MSDSSDMLLNVVLVEGRRRRRVRQRVALSLGVGGVAMAGVAAAWAWLPIHDDAVASHGSGTFQVYEFRYGFGWEMHFTAERSGDIDSASWTFGAQKEVALGYDDSVYSGNASASLADVSRGDRIYMEAHIMPRCDGTDDPPELSLRWADGQVETWTASNGSDFKEAVSKWCKSKTEK